MSLMGFMLQLVLVTLLLPLSGADLLYATPNNDTSCPGEPCHTLDYYIQDPLWYFTSNTTVELLPGTHLLRTEGEVIITEIKKFAILGSDDWHVTNTKPTSTIMCQNRLLFRFHLVTDLILRNLAIANCGFRGYTLYLSIVTDLKVSKLLVTNSSGYGLQGVNILGTSTIVDSSFIRNTGGNVALNYSCLLNEKYIMLDIGTVNFTIESSQFTEGHGSSGLTIDFINPCLDSYIQVYSATFYNNGGVTNYGGNVFIRVDRDGNITYPNKVNITIENSVMTGGTAFHGGNIYIHANSAMPTQTYITIVNTIIQTGSADRGGGLYIVTLSDGITNTCSNGINQIRIENTSITSNSANHSGGGLDVLFNFWPTCWEQSIHMYNVRFDKNTALGMGGNADIQMYLDVSDQKYNPVSTPIAISFDNCSIRNGISGQAGGLSIVSVLTVPVVAQLGRYYSSSYAKIHILNTDVMNNMASDVMGGGGLQAIDYITSTGMSWKIRVINCTFTNNTAVHGSALSFFTYHQPLTFSNLQLVLQGVLVAENRPAAVFDLNYPNRSAALSIQTIHNVTITDCQFLNNIGGAIAALESSLLFQGTSIIRNNTAFNGGAIQLCSDSFLFFEKNTTVHFIDKHAMHVGGAIYIEQHECEPSTIYLCFFQYPLTQESTIHLIFENNTATYAGSALYGGRINECVHLVRYNNTIMLPKSTLKLFSFNQKGDSVVSSDPVGICLCKGDKVECNQKSRKLSLYPGQTFTISAVAVGQMNGTVPAVVYAQPLQGDSHSEVLSDFQDSQIVQNTCTTLNYTIYSTKDYETLELTPVNSNPDVPGGFRGNSLSTFSAPNISITLLKCPPGFELSKEFKCDCIEELHKLKVTCNIDRETIRKTAGIWIGYLHRDANATEGGSSADILVHEHCPFDYCKDRNVDINPNSSNDQCAFNHYGILCGGCRPGLSLALGTSQCMECSSKYLTLLLAFAAAGLGLVVLLTVFNLTVSEGTLNALIFYANIVQVNKAIFFPNQGNAFTILLTVFIAWLNLDLGIETCFYDGMDVYAKAWLQFLFPIYIWLLVIAMVISSHYSTAAAKVVSRSNAPKVLATLFLLSYAKLLRAALTVFSFTFLKYPDGQHSLWLYDGNIDYLSGKHIPLFLVAVLVLLLFSVPYTAIVVSIQCLQRRSGFRMLSWVRRLKPLLDAYTGPYKDKYRFWTGLLLLVRIFLFLGFAANTLGDPAHSLLLITATCLFLLILRWTFQRIYKRWPLDVLEASFLVNLTILSLASIYVRLINGDQAALGYTSASIALVMFIAIFMYHIITQTKASKFWKYLQPSPPELRNLAGENTGGAHEHSIQPQDRVQPLRLTFDENNEPLFVVDEEAPARVHRETFDADEECILVIENERRP